MLSYPKKNLPKSSRFGIKISFSDDFNKNVIDMMSV